MRAVVVTEPGGPEVLQVQDVPDAVAGPGEVLIRVAAAALNRADLLQRQGNYPPPPGAPPYLGMECSGTIAALGEGVVGWQVGDEVCALLAGGAYAELVAAPAGQLMPVPAGVDLVDAAALPEATCTVWSMLFGAGRLQPGESVLIHGGTSGIGTFAIQLAHARGSRVFATAGTPRKTAFCVELGADVAINYRDEEFEHRVIAETGNAGVDVVLDNMGAAYLGRNVLSLAVGGRLIVLGLQGGRVGELDLGFMLAKRLWAHAAGLRGRSLEQKAAIVTETVHAVWPMLESGAVRPIIDRVLTLDDAGEAHRLVESSEHIGKVLLRAE
ncbi:MAG TPA: NAD(P)H-quinone oxidoreductase [Jatrophihabitantaceae bacterium]|nr:NAD(P)H-quinone oxidoreductase [Jatrophihabitantaceae bacterium]